jgi:NAD-dependent SIR2 family protein deacetylase
MIVIGTSLVVEPFASLVCKASPPAPRLLINRCPGTKAEVMVDSMSIYWGFLFMADPPKNIVVSTLKWSNLGRYWGYGAPPFQETFK